MTVRKSFLRDGWVVENTTFKVVFRGTWDECIRYATNNSATYTVFN